MPTQPLGAEFAAGYYREAVAPVLARRLPRSPARCAPG
jgi:hypothetical protein